jgi:hypothetical protein
VEFELGQKACGKTPNKIHYFNQVVRQVNGSAGLTNTDHSKCLFQKDSSQETVRKAYREWKNPKPTHIAAIQSQNHVRFPNVV